MKEFQINNNFILIGMGFGFWLISMSFLNYGMFFSGTINFDQNISFIEIMYIETTTKSARPLLVIIAIIIATLLSLKSFIELRKYPKYITTFSDTTFVNIPIATDVDLINHNEVMEIRKSFFPLFGNRKEGFLGISIYVLLLLPFALLVVVPIFLIMYFIKLLLWLTVYKNKDSNFLLYSFIIVMKSETEVININLMTKEQYEELDAYLQAYFNTDINSLAINTTLTKKGRDNGK